nr:immunoglobulin light chain junction region [Macaca mulatta]MOX12934.1 immunoglobulin light chain junction region [Macaca mulatta]
DYYCGAWDSSVTAPVLF